ncbi:MAG: pyruvate, phosphate dikinase, partial [Actinomycetota bacterium]|nr:pyruvate, phosphate dikinase [Actinomycetota bacterium]
MHALSRQPARRCRARSLPWDEASAGTGNRPFVVDLTDAVATDPELTGRKAATLALACRHGFPVLPGFVVTTEGCALLAAGADGAPDGPAHALGELHRAWSALSDSGRHALVVRSSSPGEDGATSSMAGRFTSVLGVRTRAAFLEAVQTVVDSARLVAAGADDGPAGAAAPMAVLVQAQVFPRWGGVLFGVDPVTGRRDRLVVAAVDGGPDQLVSGTVDGSRTTLSRRGRVLDVEGDGPRLPARHRRALARLAAGAARAFSGPQDVEWALDAERGLLLLQTRPVTAVGEAALASGPVLGPGPVAETFPEPLGPLEADLWLSPLRAALAEAVLLTGAAPRRRVGTSPVVTTVGGRAAADLDLLGVAPRRRSLGTRLDPRPPARRLWAAWRTGRLRAALPGLARDLLARADAELASVPAPASMDDAALLRVLRGSERALVSLHAHEVLAGMLATTGEAGAGGTSGAGAALHALAAARRQGLADHDIVARHPVVLALVPPSIAAPAPLPEVLVVPPATDARGGVDELAELREGLRLRVRWVHELTAVVARELGARLARRDLLSAAEAVPWLSLADLEAAVTGGVAPVGVEARRAA